MLALLAYHTDTLKIVELATEVLYSSVLTNREKHVFSNSTKDCIIEALANPEKERMKHDDTTISSWLQS